MIVCRPPIARTDDHTHYITFFQFLKSLRWFYSPMSLCIHVLRGRTLLVTHIHFSSSQRSFTVNGPRTSNRIYLQQSIRQNSRCIFIYAPVEDLPVPALIWDGGYVLRQRRHPARSLTVHCELDADYKY